MVIANGLFNLVFTDGLSLGTLIAFGVLSILPAWWLSHQAMGKGYRLLSDGADKDYRPERDLYMEGQYAKAFVHLKPSAKRGHMKSLYLLGHSHEHGKGRKRDRVKAARFYDKSGRKGYGKAHLECEALFETFSPYSTNLDISGVSKLTVICAGVIFENLYLSRFIMMLFINSLSAVKSKVF